LMSDNSVKTLWMIGAGQMGQALYNGWCNAGLAIGEMILIDPSQTADKLTLRANDRFMAMPNEATPIPDVLLFAIKPQMANDVLPVYADYLQPHTLVISIMAGLGLDKMIRLLDKPTQPIIRTMPNTPAMVGQGITAAFGNTSVSAHHRQIAESLLSAVGKSVWVDNEDHMHAITALSGSGPAYVFALIETMAQAGIEAGLDADLAMTLARQTVIGSGALAAAKPEASAEELRRNVTSPGGTTEAGLDVLLAKQSGLNELITAAIKAAAKRSRALSGQG
jgi:pyrroline-5-carboxylate reductase